jgi:hypothetical protein
MFQTVQRSMVFGLMSGVAVGWARDFVRAPGMERWTDTAVGFSDVVFCCTIDGTVSDKVAG